MNYSGKLAAIIKLIRPFNFLIIFLSIIVAGIISSGNTAGSQFSENIGLILLAALSGAFAASAGYVINDYFDLYIDQVNRPDRPLPSGAVKQNEAAAIYFILFLASLILSAFINIAAFLTVLIASNLLFLYSYKLKSTVLTGNITVAFLTGLAFIYGGIALNNIEGTFLPALFAFLINFIRELVKDIEDMKGDIKEGVLTFPGKYGISRSKLLITFITGALILLTFIPFILHLYKIEFTIAVALAVDPILIYFLKSLYENHSLKSLHKLSNILKLDMAIGLAAIYFGK
jgi:geranylgeranylglycerol-phosphate geranylgeranyltransferase